MSGKMISTTIYISQEQEWKLKELSKRTKVPVSVYVREGIDAVISNNYDLIEKQTKLKFK